MSMWHDLKDVSKMFSEGGLQVVTLIAEPEGDTAVSSPPSPSPVYQGKIYDRRGIRTTIQFDLDYITTLSPEVLGMRELWERHTDVLQKKLIILQRIRYWVRRSWLLFLLYPIYTFISALTTHGVSGESLSLICSLLLGVAIVLARKWMVRLLCKLLRPLVLSPVRWYVRRRFQRFVSMPAKE
ncbi:MAG: hypothetical protein M3Q16_10365 [Pseudomonadota bacterium]|nr:hypothetical protein [Pseudomonadota bacterium]